jgi:hypothetical protein
MPLYKTGDDMFTKYSAKYNPTVVSTRFTDVKETALKRAQAGLTATATIREGIRKVLDTHGIAGGTRATYLAFGTKLWKHVNRQKETCVTPIKNGLVAYFKTAYGLSETILNAVATAVLGG